MDLIRPYNYQLVKIARSFGEALFRILFFTLPSAVLFYFLMPFKLPPNLLTGVMFMVALVGSFLINAQISFLTGILSFFTNNSTGLIRAKGVVVDLLSGLLIPLSFYPPWAMKIISFLPFQSISYLPNMLYLGKAPGMAGLKIIGIQLLWAVILFVLNTLIWRTAVKQLTVQGG